MSKYLKVADIKTALIELVKNGKWLERKTTMNIIKALGDLPTIEIGEGKWTKIDVCTYRCSECGKIQVADDTNELNFCCNCGSKNKKG